MKKDILITVVLLIVATVSFSQDFSDEKTVQGLRNTKFVSANKKEKAYAVILSDNSFLNIKYNVVQSGEFNGTYSFIKVPSAFLFKNNKEFNVKFLKDNIVFMCKTIGMRDDQIQKIKKAIDITQFTSSKSTLILADIDGYDESSITFLNSEMSISCTFLFRRLL